MILKVTVIIVIWMILGVCEISVIMERAHFFGPGNSPQSSLPSSQPPARKAEGVRTYRPSWMMILSSPLETVQAKGGTLCVLRESEGHCRCTSASKRNGLLQCHPLSTDALGSFCFPGHVDISLVSRACGYFPGFPGISVCVSQEGAFFSASKAWSFTSPQGLLGSAEVR